jgi:glycosyltransferase involved in cell wall biosynthesis
VKLLILYTEIAGYTLACLREFVLQYPKVEIHLVRWPVNEEAPFDFSFDRKITVYERNKLTGKQLLELAEKIQPTAILCSGWIDKDYLSVCKKWKNKIPVILVMDNKWLGTWKQQIARLVSSFSILRRFNFAWVPGEEQKKYALHLGFPEKNTRTGFYSADVPFFHQNYLASRELKSKKMPHRFIFAGRYYDFKGVNELWEAFVKWKTSSSLGEKENDWELWCVGTGDVAPVEHSAIKHLGFVQPENMREIMNETGVFILPSLVEPWGVAVHEFAAAGFPLLLSEQVGAASTFLKNGQNGFSFKSGDVDGIITAMKSISALSNEKIFRMGEISSELAETITPRTWSETLFEIIKST